MRKDIIVHESPKAPASEAVRLLRTNLSFISQNSDQQVLLVTSAAPGDGKSWVSANIAIAYAQTGKKVLLVDADMRKGRQHKIFGKMNTVGFSDFLNGVHGLENDLELQAEILQKSILSTEVKGLFLVPSGTVPPNPSELLGSQFVDSFLEIVTQNFDVVIFDGPPVSIVTDSLILCKKVEYVVLVVAAEQTKKDMIVNAKKSIEHVGGNIAGVVLNKMPTQKRKEYNKYYMHYAEDLPATVNARERRKAR